MPLTLKESVKNYCMAEFRFIWTLLQFNNSSKEKKTVGNFTPLFILSKAHQKSLRELNEALRDKDETQIEKVLRTLYDLLYFPSQEERDQAYKKPVHIYPLLQYIVFTFITPEGAYHPIHLLPPPLSRYQYCIRLHGLHRINQEVTEDKNRDWRK